MSQQCVRLELQILACFKLGERSSVCWSIFFACRRIVVRCWEFIIKQDFCHSRHICNSSFRLSCLLILTKIKFVKSVKLKSSMAKNLHLENLLPLLQGRLSIGFSNATKVGALLPKLGQFLVAVCSVYCYGQ